MGEMKRTYLITYKILVGTLKGKSYCRENGADERVDHVEGCERALWAG
jgi:hypothetical protein